MVLLGNEAWERIPGLVEHWSNKDGTNNRRTICWRAQAANRFAIRAAEKLSLIHI